MTDRRTPLPLGTFAADPPQLPSGNDWLGDLRKMTEIVEALRAKGPVLVGIEIGSRAWEWISAHLPVREQPDTSAGLPGRLDGLTGVPIFIVNRRGVNAVAFDYDDGVTVVDYVGDDGKIYHFVPPPRSP